MTTTPMPPVHVTNTPPPSCDHDEDDGDDTPSSRISLTVVTADDEIVDAGVHLLEGEVDDPDRFASAAVRVVLGAAATRGSAHHWAMVCALRDFQGGRA